MKVKHNIKTCSFQYYIVLNLYPKTAVDEMYGAFVHDNVTLLG